MDWRAVKTPIKFSPAVWSCLSLDQPSLCACHLGRTWEPATLVLGLCSLDNHNQASKTTPPPSPMDRSRWIILELNICLTVSASYTTHCSPITVCLFIPDGFTENRCINRLKKKQKTKKKKPQWTQDEHYFQWYNNRCCFKAVSRCSQMLLLVHSENICPSDTDMKPGLPYTDN